MLFMFTMLYMKLLVYERLIMIISFYTIYQNFWAICLINNIVIRKNMFGVNECMALSRRKNGISSNSFILFGVSLLKSFIEIAIDMLVIYLFYYAFISIWPFYIKINMHKKRHNFFGWLNLFLVDKKSYCTTKNVFPLALVVLLMTANQFLNKTNLFIM
jgi:hypothetical protein